MFFSGPSGCGKSSVCARLIRRAADLYEKPPGLVLYCYNEWQPLFDVLSREGVHMHEGLPTIDTLKQFKGRRLLLILDDLITNLHKNPDAEKLFSVFSHHFDMSCIVILHSIFYSKTVRNMRLNCSYLCLFKNNADKLSVRYLASQLYPNNRNFFIQSFEDATQNPHSYLLVDVHKDTPKEFRLRTSFFHDEELTFCYLEKNGRG